MISVVMPVYNVEKYIGKSIESIINQTFHDFELILVNDGSLDNSIIVAKEILMKSNINWRIINQKNGGLACARNTGVKEAIGEYITFVDSDDLISPFFLEHMSAVAKKYDIDLAFCDFIYIKNQIIPNLLFSNEENVMFANDILMEFLIRKFEIAVPTFIIKKDFLFKNQIQFESSVKFSEDQIFMWTCFLYVEKVVYLKNKLYYYYKRENSIMTSSNFDKIISGYTGINNLINRYHFPEQIGKYVLPRWVLGALYSSSKYMTYEEFKLLYQSMNAEDIMKSMKKFPELKAKIASILSINPYLFYIVSKKIM